MEMEHSFEGIDEIDEESELDEEVVDEMIADSCVVRIIDEMEFFEEDLDYFDESDIHRELS